MVWRKIQQSPQLQRYAQASSAPSQDMVNPINALMLQQQLLAQQQKIALQTANSPALGAVHQNAETSAAAEKTSPTSVASDLVFPLSRDQFDTLYAQFQLETGIHIGRVPVFASKPLDLYGLFASCIALTGTTFSHHEVQTYHHRHQEGFGEKVVETRADTDAATDQYFICKQHAQETLQVVPGTV